MNSENSRMYYAIKLSVMILAIILLSAGFFDTAQRKLTDCFFAFRGDKKVSEDIVIIEIGDISVAEMGGWPFKRSIHASLLESLTDAKVIAFDMAFPGYSENEQDDQVFLDALCSADCVTAIFQNNDGSITRSFPEVYEAAAGTGCINSVLDSDGTMRRTGLIYALVENGTVTAYPSFALEIFRIFKNADAIITKDHFLETAGQKILLDSDGRFIINYVTGAPQSREQGFKKYRYADVYSKKYPKSEFAGKIVLVGPTYMAAHDSFLVPYFSQTAKEQIIDDALLEPRHTMHGVEIQANIIQSLLDNRYLISASSGKSLAFFSILGCILLVMPLKTRLVYNTALCTAIGTGAVVGGYWEFLQGILYPSVPVFCYALFCALLNPIFKYADERKRRRHITGIFGRYLHHDVVKRLIEDKKALELGGERTDASVLFLDVCGFTTFSENLDPREVLNRLNEYFDFMTDIIFAQNGMLDKFIGDAIMAVFGIPVYYKGHEINCVQAAIDIQKRVAEVNKEMEKLKRQPLFVSIGINSGPLVAGNIGSSKRQEYTVIGDTVNLASRLEGKAQKNEVIISEHVYEKVKKHFSCEYLDEITVKGKKIPVKIYRVNY